MLAFVCCGDVCCIECEGDGGGWEARRDSVLERMSGCDDDSDGAGGSVRNYDIVRILI